jgi:CubicO group peptidase (beta-lactamase class C family)
MVIKMKNKKYKLKSVLRICMCTYVLLTLFSSSTITALTIDQIFNENFDSEVETKMEAAHAPSSTVSVINSSEVVFEKGYGAQSELDTVYPLYSINKPILAVAILQLYEDGIIDLDEDINSYLPFEIRNPYWPSIPITCKQLLSHQSSLKDRFNEMYEDIIFNSTIPFPEYIYELTNENGSLYSIDLWRDYQPGTGSTYSSLDFDILGYILELKTGDSIDQYLNENIFVPLDMLSTKRNWSDFIQSKRAIPYTWKESINDYEQLDWIDLGGAMDYKTTIEDLSNLLIALMNGGAYDSVRILEDLTVDIMIQDYADGFGLGIFVNTKIKQDSNIRGYNGHIGVGPGYILNMYFKENIGVIFFTNQNDEAGQALADIMPIYHYIFDKAEEINKIPTEETNFHTVTIITLLVSLTVFRFMIKRRKNC